MRNGAGGRRESARQLSRGSIRRRLGAAATFLAVSVVPASLPAPAHAGPPLDGTVVGTACAPNVDWRGGEVYQVFGRAQFFMGTARLCLYTLRYRSANGYAYLGGWSSLEVAGSTSSGDAAASLSIRSSLPAVGTVYFATGDAYGGSCSTPISIGFQAGPFSLAAQPRICSGGSITRSRLDSIVAAWTTDKIGLTRLWEEEYVQKLPGGSRPTFSAVARLPRYVEIASPVAGQPGVYTYSVRPTWTSVQLSL